MQLRILAESASRALVFARRPELLALLPAATLAAYWLGGEGWLVATALLVPLVYGLAGAFGVLPAMTGSPAPLRAGDDVCLRESLLERLAENLRVAGAERLQAGALVVVLDDVPALEARLGPSGVEEVLAHLQRQVRARIRSADLAARLDGARIAVAIAPQLRGGGQDLYAIARRLQQQLSVPLRIDGSVVPVSVSIGAGHDSGRGRCDPVGLLESAEIAADDAAGRGKAQVRLFVRGMTSARGRLRGIAAAFSAALDQRAVRAVFQPQTCARTGRVTGAEALVRWHRDGNDLSPAGFLDDIHAAGLSEQLTHRMVGDALDLLESCDRQGIALPAVAVNLSAEELRLRHLADLIIWELDRRDLAPERLVLEILESVIATGADDVMVNNIARLASCGCGIDLDDFGTGHASIATIRRFAIGRVKIDRSFVRAMDSDPRQYRLVAAIVSMSRELGLQTVAEGVETGGELKAVAAVGCDHAQGYLIARPMEAGQMRGWLADRADPKGSAQAAP